ncbi:unnamed protein product [Leptidea sinapis]|uniref:Uncharacterized protein n=1 Tax=Leptidea sinapis TaxID=189913 RepID=A0A5E4QDJ4_9NEOP|nr:unnamed protein product [Leptidea sinapis]
MNGDSGGRQRRTPAPARPRSAPPARATPRARTRRTHGHAARARRRQPTGAGTRGFHVSSPPSPARTGAPPRSPTPGRRAAASSGSGHHEPSLTPPQYARRARC